ncbi:hypothetical protein CRUP_008596 [Coryphaenoides rupestris]|nr:hypothetical protein CRUP_008596 [Coryphaenoides rupestris]
MTMSRRSPLWILLGLSLVLVLVLGDQQGHQNQTVQENDDRYHQSKAKKTFRLVSITSAQSQVTNVINFKLEAILGKTVCLKSDANDMEKCNLGKKRLGCRFEVRFDVRKQIHKMERSSCKKISSPSSPTSSST